MGDDHPATRALPARARCSPRSRCAAPPRVP
jgi:hypothetical protein